RVLTCTPAARRTTAPVPVPDAGSIPAVPVPADPVPAEPGPAEAGLADAPAPLRSAATWTAAPPAATGASPTWHAGGDVRVEPRSGAELPPLDAGPAGRDRIELARAYLELGDTDTARSLLQEVADFGDPGPRDEALQLLRELA